jgi:hypothetical protein
MTTSVRSTHSFAHNANEWGTPKVVWATRQSARCVGHPHCLGHPAGFCQVDKACYVNRGREEQREAALDVGRSAGVSECGEGFEAPTQSQEARLNGAPGREVRGRCLTRVLASGAGHPPDL